MATLEKLVRTVEALKLHQTPSVTVDETMAKKDKISHCVSVTDIICSQVRVVVMLPLHAATLQGLKNSPESAKYLAMAMEMFFTLVDDQDADVRMVADENLNRITRSLGDSSVGRLQVELYKEVKRNGSSRCVRAALLRFSALASHIRPAKVMCLVLSGVIRSENMFSLNASEILHACSTLRYMDNMVLLTSLGVKAFVCYVCIS